MKGCNLGKVNGEIINKHGGCNLSRVRSLERKVPYNNCSIDSEGLTKYLETFLEMR